MPTHAVIPFTVTGWEPTPYEEELPGPRLFRVTVRKTYNGALVADSVGQLLMCVADGDNLAAGAGFVISERVSGSLEGRAGSFVLQAWGVSGGDEQTTAGHIVPGSGTGALAGLTGSLTIAVTDDGDHTLLLDYTIA